MWLLKITLNSRVPNFFGKKNRHISQFAKSWIRVFESVAKFKQTGLSIGYRPSQRSFYPGRTRHEIHAKVECAQPLRFIINLVAGFVMDRKTYLWGWCLAYTRSSVIASSLLVNYLNFNLKCVSQRNLSNNQHRIYKALVAKQLFQYLIKYNYIILVF